MINNAEESFEIKKDEFISPLSLALDEFKIDRECFEEILADNKTDENKINEIIKEIIEIKNFLKLLNFF